MKTLNQTELEAVSGGINPFFLPAIIIALPLPGFPEPSEEPVTSEGAE